MKKCTAFVFSGGGSHGALQVGAARSLLEAGIYPDLLVGTSIGAANATGLALWGANLDGVASVEQAWHKVSDMELLDKKISPLMLRALFNRTSNRTKTKIEELLISLGITPEIRFDQINNVRLGLVSADLETGQPVIYGMEPSESILEGLLASTAIQPWFPPVRKDGQLLIDGGVLSNLPIEPALRMGATEIYALDLNDGSLLPKENPTPLQYLEKYYFALCKRHAFLETALAVERNIPVHYMEFQGLSKVPIWDFSQNEELIQAGYRKAHQIIREWARID
jgi:NTE family protein